MLLPHSWPLLPEPMYFLFMLSTAFALTLHYLYQQYCWFYENGNFSLNISNIKWTNYKGLMCHTSYNIFCSLPFNSLTMDVIYTCQIGLAQILLFEAHIEKQLTYPNSERKITPPCNLFHLVCRCYFPFPIM